MAFEYRRDRAADAEATISTAAPAITAPSP
jgi:hypothetical protein